jgi:hypothetical protein
MGMEQSMHERNTEQVESPVQKNPKTDWNSISQVDGTDRPGLDTKPSVYTLLGTEPNPDGTIMNRPRLDWCRALLP